MAIRATSAATVLAVVLTASAGCSQGSSPSSTDASPIPAVPGGAADDEVVEVQPGGPGEPSSTVVALPGERWNHDDIAFVQMMLVHHRQALDMAALAPARAGDPAVVAVAERIEAAQAPEILVLASLLDDQGVDVPLPDEDPRRYDHRQHGHRGMAGMLGPERMRELEAAEGSRFDRLFLRGMIEHHLGAIEMASHVRRHGSSTRVGELAQDVQADQSAEVTRMEAVSATLP